MSQHRLQRDMIECGLLPKTGTADDAVAVLAGLRREAKASQPRRGARRGWTGPVLAVALAVVLATVAVMLSWSALAMLPTLLVLAVLPGLSTRSAPRRGAVTPTSRSPRQPQRQ